MTRLRVPGVNPVRRKLATGEVRTYYYHRATGTRISADPEADPASFAAEVDKLNVKIKRLTPIPTLGDLMKRYKQSPEFAQLSGRTRQDYEQQIHYLDRISDMPISEITPAFLIKLRDITFKKRKRWFANMMLRFLSLLFNWGRPRGFCDDNPASRTPKVRAPIGARRANRPLEPEEVATLLDAALGGMRVAIALAVFAGLRQGDVIRCARHIYNGQAIEIVTRKRGKRVRAPAAPELREVLDGWLAERGDTAITMVVNTHGQPFTQSGFRASFFGLVRRLEAKGVIGEGVTFHGLRHTAGCALADAGCTAHEIAAVLGVTEAQAKSYSDRGDKAAQAASAMSKLRAHLQNKLQNAEEKDVADA